MAEASKNGDSTNQNASNLLANNGSRVIGNYSNNNDKRKYNNGPHNNFSGKFTAGRDQYAGNQYTGDTINIGGGGRDTKESDEDRDKKLLAKEFPKIEREKVDAIYGVAGGLGKAREMLKLL